MEKHISLDERSELYRPGLSDTPAHWFKKAVEFSNTFYSEEISRASKVSFEDLSPELFFSEYIWVVHATGFSAKAVSQFIPRLIPAYGSFDICGTSELDVLLSRVLPVCNNRQKAKAVWQMSKIIIKGIGDRGWEAFKKSELYPVDSLSKLPYIGNITKYHLGRNIGILDCVKPDLHFVRMAAHWGYSDAHSMITDMNRNFSYPLGIADMIAWYYASSFGTLYMKKVGQR